ncbi:ABC transporter transmembrane domain-containing protein [Ferrovibrio sp.]|uniref:ABC transporter transmembrane domain-containing protein n=1 Tax=Ferrovibrio sp. TaxID=1917215 RepID=UPI001B65DFDF|nr:ABC transporter transmembrane domain-containing protein [Ferrovibrio sp.]MBP7064432.1 ATP-binding cassette domain-containing protein [Ferrovibrio sp.]
MTSPAAPSSSATPSAKASGRPGFGPLARLLSFVLPYRWIAAGAGVALVVAAVAVLGIGQAIRRVIDVGFGSGGDGTMLDLYFGALFGVVVVLAIATYARFYCVTWLGERVVADVRKAVFAHVLKLSPAFFESTRTGEVLSRLTTDTELIQTLVGSSISVALRNLLLFIGSAALLLITSPRLTMLVALVIPLVVLPIIVFGRRLRVLSRQSQDRVADLSAQAGETLNAITTVQAYTAEAREARRFGQNAESAFGTAVRRTRARASLTALVMLLVFGAVNAVMWIGGKAVFAGEMSGGELSAFVFYAVIGAAAVGALSEVWGDVQRAAGAAERLMQLLGTEPGLPVPAQPLQLPARASGQVQFDAIRFAYPARPGSAAIDNLSLDIAAGETVAIVGPSGAGKTTLFQLLQRFYDPQGGTIRIDGLDVRRLDPVAMRRQIGLVAQEPVIFGASVAENIRYGRPEADDAAIRAAAEAAAAHGFIQALPQGYDTYLGERGVRLSGGQRQRIAIARALLRDPPILLLDEATSSLDAESERKVQLALERLMRGRTTLVIAHRLATVQKADRIVVMEKGRIVASGRHDSLMREGGLYARLARLQFMNETLDDGQGTDPAA